MGRRLEEDADAQAGEAKEADEDAVAPAGDEEQAAVAPAGDEEQQVDGTPVMAMSRVRVQRTKWSLRQGAADEENPLMPVMDGRKRWRWHRQTPKTPKTLRLELKQPRG